MTKSRMALPILCAGAAAWPGAASAQSRPPTAEDEIVVCGRSDDARMRVPYQPEPGARVRLIAGEAPSAMGALNAGASPRGGGIDVIGLFNALGRGLDRILHPD